MMGSVCAKSQEPELLQQNNRGEPASPASPIENGKVAPTENNNDPAFCEPCQGDENCADYVKKALDKQKITIENVTDFSSCFPEPPGDELTFNFDNVTINSTGFDEVDGISRRGSLIHAVSVTDVGATPVHAGDGSTDEVDIQKRRTKWSKSRRREFDYEVSADKYSTITEHKIDVKGSDKREVITISDLHLGGAWADGMDGKLDRYLNTILDTAKEKVAAIVLLGDIFEMWLEKFPEIPPTNQERVDFWKQSSPVLAAAIIKLVDECGVEVFYVRGNHDREITDEDVKDIFDNRVTFVPCTLILSMQTSDENEHRIRFAHGHEYDIFNSYMLCKTNNLLPDKPIGYYIARAVATSGRADSDGELEDILIGLAQNLLTMVPSALEDDLIDVLLDKDQHRKLIERLFEGAFKVKDIEFLAHAKCRISEDKWIRLNTMLEYPLLRLCGSMVGKQDVFHMLKASTGDYKKFIKRTDEDVIVLAHTHRWDLKKYRNYRGNQVIYANTGCWTNKCEEFSSVVISPPTAEDDGVVMIDHGKNHD